MLLRPVAGVLAVAACSLGFDDENYRGPTGGGGSLDPCNGALLATDIPPGWNGPVLLAQGADEDQLPLCPFSQSMVYADLQPEPLGCMCECEVTPAVNVCAAKVSAYTSEGCDGTAFNQSVEGMCTAIPSSLIVSGEWTPEPLSSRDLCFPAAAPVRRVVGWGTSTVLCAAPATLIDGGLCVDPQSGFEARVCVYSSAAAPCPSGFPTALDRYESYDDTRGCGECQCGSGTLSCAGTVDIFSDSGCSNLVLSVAPNACANVTGQSYGKYNAAYAGACETIMKPESGAVVPTGPMRVCCTS